MILGINWYREFPNGLYSYKFFEFRRSPGGFADHPAELIAKIKSEFSNYLYTEIENFISQYPQARLFVRRKESKLEISIGWYSLFDFDFCLANEIDKIINKCDAVKIINENFSGCEILRLGNHNLYQGFYYPKIENAGIVYSDLAKHNAINSAYRITCNILNTELEETINKFKQISKICNFNTFFYTKAELVNRINLYLFLTNGRQGLGLNQMEISDGNRLEVEINTLLSKEKIKLGQSGDYNYSPKGKVYIVKIENKDFFNLMG